MKENKQNNVGKIHLLVKEDIINSTNVEIEELQKCYTFLFRIFKEKFFDFFPLKIKSVVSLKESIILCENLKKLEQCNGFEKHIKNYNRAQFSSNFFVASVAGYLASKVDKLVLEPKIITKKSPDIYVEYKNENIYLECKIIETEQYKYREDHERIFDILSQYINLPYQLTITYDKELSDEKIHELGEKIAKKLSLVTNEGNIISSEDLKVHVIPRNKISDKRFYIIMEASMKKTYNNCAYPCHLFFKDGLTVVISGPLVDFSKILKNKLEKSREQNHPDYPFILVIDTNPMLGDYEENLRFIETAFQPELNTRFSGVLLTEYGPNFDKFYLKFTFISNPFTKFPVSKEFELLFMNSDI